MTAADLRSLITEAFFYGYPLVSDLDEIVRFTKTGMGRRQPLRRAAARSSLTKTNGLTPTMSITALNSRSWRWFIGESR